MNCLICKTPMAIRKGKFGPFYYCPNGSHGTISVAKYEALKVRTATGGINDLSPGAKGCPEDPLMQAVEKHTAMLGGGVLTDMERLFVDNEAFYDDPEDFWQNLRPY